MAKAINAIIGDPVKRENLEKRYWPKVAVRGPNECWEWSAKAKHAYGYGRMTAGRGVHLKAHQIGWAIANGPIPAGLLVCHKCDNPSCSNPAHLFLGTQVDNMRDAAQKGRASAPPHWFGEAHPRSAIKDIELEQIRQDKRPVRLIADQFGVSQKTIYRIRQGLR